MGRKIERSMFVVGILAIIALLTISLSYVGLIYTRPGVDRNAVLFSSYITIVGGVVMAAALLALSARPMRIFTYMLMFSSICNLVSGLRIAINAQLGFDMCIILLSAYASFVALAIILRLIHSHQVDDCPKVPNL